jgi:restriction endonuclease S subunit
MTKLPDGWKSQTLRDWGMQAQSGFASGVHNSEGTGVIHLRPMNVSRLGKLDFYNFKSVEDNSSRRIKKGDILFNNTNSAELVGKTALVDIEGDFAFSNHMTRLRFPDEKVMHKYMAMLLHSFWMSGYFNEICSNHVNQASVSIRRLEQVEVLLPSIDEQHRIVELLDEYLSRLDAALAEVKQAKIKAARFRRSFVHEMTTAIESSEVMGILDICDVYQPKTISTKELISDGEFPVYGANGQIGFYDKFNHEDSEVTVTCRGATCGTVNVIPAMSWITGNAMVFRPKDSRIQKGFLEYVLRGMDWTPVITGTAQPQITRTSIQDVFVNVPSPYIQSEIYMKLESSLTQVTNASLLIEKVEMQVASLRRSLLQAALTGQLTKEVARV